MSNATCSEDGCDRPVKGRGLCQRDYMRWRRAQDPDWAPEQREPVPCLIGDCGRRAKGDGYCRRHGENRRIYGNPVPRKERPLGVRLNEIGWTVTASGCWEWNGKRNDNGYGIFSARRLGYESARAHRVMYECVTGEELGARKLRHTCDNPPCVNPEHLIPGTMADNTRDMIERGRAPWQVPRTRCGNGHDLTVPDALRTVARVRDGKQVTETVCVECRRTSAREYETRKRREQGIPVRRRAVEPSASI